MNEIKTKSFRSEVRDIDDIIEDLKKLSWKIVGIVDEFEQLAIDAENFQKRGTEVKDELEKHCINCPVKKHIKNKRNTNMNNLKYESDLCIECYWFQNDEIDENGDYVSDIKCKECKRISEHKKPYYTDKCN
jgi:hypothetical protein